MKIENNNVRRRRKCGRTTGPAREQRRRECLRFFLLALRYDSNSNPPGMSISP